MSRRAAPAWLHIVTIAFVLIAGAALRISQFAANPSLWFDEVAVARNVFDRPLGALLFEPLDYGQTAPPGFLLAEKTATLLLGCTDWGLRLLPFLASLASLFVFAHLAVSMMTPETRAYLQRFWATGFLPLTLAAAMETWWPWDRLRAFIGTGGAGGGRISLAYPMPAVYFGIACAGLYAILS